MMRKIPLLVFSFFLSLIFANKQPAQNILQKIKKLSNLPELRQAEWAVCAKYADNSQPIIEFNSNKNLTPASGLKVFTTSAAFDLLGSEFRYQTKLYYKGIIKNGTLNGDLIIKGSGDPTFGSDRVSNSPGIKAVMQRWLNALKKNGIKTIKGKIIADASFFDNIPVSGMWYWIDLGNYYAAGTSGLSVCDNYYRLYFKPSNRVGEPAKIIRTEPAELPLKFINHIKTAGVGSGDNGYIYRAPNQHLAILRGTIPQGKKEFFIKGSLPDPPLFLAGYFKNFLVKNGISFHGETLVLNIPFNYNNAVIIDSVSSPPLKEIIAYILNKSDNFYTEQLLKTFARIKAGKGSRKAGIKLIKYFLAEHKIDTTGLNLYDGCGLSRSNTITANMMVDLLISNTKEKWFADFYNSLPVVKGNSSKRKVNKFGARTILVNNARIKNGYISGVRSHSGYLRNKAGRLICFSLIANNFTSKVKSIDKIHEKVLILLANTGHALK